MLRAGFGKADITPPAGSVLAGSFSPRVSRRVRDPLYASAAVLENGSERVCMVSCDLLRLGRKEVESARTLIERKTGIRKQNMLICATHTHTGPLTAASSLPGFENALEESWLSLLPYQICSAVVQAVYSLRESGAACLSGFEDGISFNRRFLMKDGSVKTNPGIGNPEILEPAGPIDPEVGVLACGRDPSEIAGAVVNFALHVCTMGAELSISADFPGVAGGLLKKAFGETAGMVYTSGASGDINHVDVNGRPSAEFKEFETASRAGAILGGEVIKTIARAERFETDIKLDAARSGVRLPLKKYSGEDLEKAKALMRENRKPRGLNDTEYMRSRGIVRASELGGGEFASEIVALRIGDAAFVSMPGELFVELGLHIKSKSPFPRTFIVELGLDCLGYIASGEACRQGAYEPLTSPLAPGAGEILAESALDLLSRLDRPVMRV